MRFWFLWVLALQAQAGTAWNPDGHGGFYYSDQRVLIPASQKDVVNYDSDRRMEVRDYRSELGFSAAWDPRYSYRASYRWLAIKSTVPGMAATPTWPLDLHEEAMAMGFELHHPLTALFAAPASKAFNPDGRVFSPSVAVDYMSRQGKLGNPRVTHVLDQDQAFRTQLTLPLARPLTLWASYEDGVDGKTLPRGIVVQELPKTETRVGLRFYILKPDDGRPWIPRMGPAGSWRFDLTGILRNGHSGNTSTGSAELMATHAWASGQTMGFGYVLGSPGFMQMLVTDAQRFSHSLKLSLGWAPGPAAAPPTAAHVE